MNPDVPASPPPSQPPVSTRGRCLFDAALMIICLLFGFAVASFAVRNSDVWFHLAVGRLAAEGGYSFGVDPIAYTTADTYWVNHAWLFDLAIYYVFRALGGTALVVLK